ncbi:hypothetical protein [Subtercola frigoramans]|uniref:Uncharacterized protein n=1 Tax=Subtercola frigoramans TaxID=120298 RepID=A0ABS2L8U8_9MICO|nr:hypothetical protein [Subtercola frigoramans]MBM7473150.1 hypothetical protein [Subtercola frigoramans]
MSELGVLLAAEGDAAEAAENSLDAPERTNVKVTRGCSTRDGQLFSDEERMNVHKVIQTSALSGRIAEGKADPITAEERAIVGELRASYEKRFGHGKSHSADTHRTRFNSEEEEEEEEEERANADADELIRLGQEMGT